MHSFLTVLFRGSRAGTGDESIEQVAEPTEYNVILRDFTSLIPGEPSVDDNGQDLVTKRRKGEHDAGSGRSDVLVGDKLEDLIVAGPADYRYAAGRRDEEAEDILGVQLTANEVASVRYPALDLWCCKLWSLPFHQI